MPIPADRLHYLNFLIVLIASASSSGFSHLWSWVFHISLQIRKTQQTGWKKKTSEQTRTWVSSKHKSGGVCDTCAFCAPKRACNRAKTLTKPLAMLTHFLTDLFCRLVSAAPFCWLCPSLDCSRLTTVIFCYLLLPVSVSPGLVGDLARKPFAWDSLTSTPHTPT